MKEITIGITLTKKCNAACAMCCIEASPNCNEFIDVDMVKSFILGTKDVEEVSGFGFSGGEVFLYYDILKDLMKTAKSVGKNSTFVTNGFWASTEEIAYKKLKELRDCGLSKFGISYDEFHSEFVDASRIRNILRAAKKLKIKYDIQVVMDKRANISKIIAALGEDISDSEVRFIPCHPAGRAKKCISDDDYIREYSSIHRFCRKGSLIDIDIEGNVWPCCSASMFETIIKIGNIKELSAKGIFEKIKNNKTLYLLRNYGFDFFNEIATEKLGMKVPQKVVSSCELCQLYFCKENYYRFLPYVHEKVEEIIREQEQKIEK